MTDEARTIYLGLRSNTQYFRSQRGFMKLEARLKTLALLYDRIVLEEGVYDCAVGPGGSFSIVTPYHDAEQLKPAPTLKRNFRVGAALTGSDQHEVVIDTPTEQRFRAQFEFILQNLAPLHPDWVETVYFDPTWEVTRAAGDTASRWIWKDSGLLSGIMPGGSSFLRDIVIKDFYTDLARAYHLDTDISPEGFYFPALTRRAAESQMEDISTGETVLPLLIPDIRNATWEDVSHVRNDKGIKNLRSKLQEIEAAGGSDAELLDRVHREYRDYMEHHRPSRLKTVVAVDWSLIGFTTLGIGAAIAQPIIAAVQAQEAQRHWTASFVRIESHLRDRAETKGWARSRASLGGQQRAPATPEQSTLVDRLILYGNINPEDLNGPERLETLQIHGPIVTAVSGGSKRLQQLIGQRMRDVLPLLEEQGWSFLNNSSYDEPDTLVSSQKWEFGRSH